MENWNNSYVRNAIWLSFAEYHKLILKSTSIIAKKHVLKVFSKIFFVVFSWYIPIVMEYLNKIWQIDRTISV